MKKQKYCLAAGALFCTSVLGAFSPALQTYATFDNSVDGSSYFDMNAQACIVENYNIENSTNITSIEQIDPAKINALNCSNRDIKNFRGVVVLTNLEILNLSGNTELDVSEMVFSENAKLKNINISDTKELSKDSVIDFSGNPMLKSISTSQDLNLITSAYVEKLNDEEEYSYGMDLSGLEFFTSTASPVIDSKDYSAKYDASSKIISYKSAVPEYVSIDYTDYVLNISSRPNTLMVKLYLQNEDSDEYEDINSNGVYGIFYYGDSFDTDKILEAIEKQHEEEYNFEEYDLSKVSLSTAASVVLTKDDTTHKEVEFKDAGQKIYLSYYLDLSDLATPDTGAFTASGSTIVATTATAAIILAGTAVYISRHATKRQKAKVRFGKK